MSHVLDRAPARGDPVQRLGAWWPVALGLLALYGPTYYDLATGLWELEEHAHGPIVLMVWIYLVWRVFPELQQTRPTRADAIAGWTLLVFGLLVYALGRSQAIVAFEVGSQIPVMTGAILALYGRSAVRTLWFPLLFLVFLVPLPGIVIDGITAPLKHYVSLIAEFLLYEAGYPVGRQGVVLSVGPYQLLVADACSGLNSMISLSAMGLLYLFLSGHRNKLRIGLLVASILPIAFCANIVRVMALVLITYHLGDEAGQGFLHDFAGILLFVVALLFLFLFDSVLGMFFGDRRLQRES